MIGDATFTVTQAGEEIESARNPNTPTVEPEPPSSTVAQSATSGEASNGTVAPRLLHKVEPEAAQKDANRRGIEGTILIGFVVDTDGKPTEMKVLKGLDADLEKGVMEALSKWRFQPATKNGHAIPCQAASEFRFRVIK
jgi:protein TonB